MDMRELKEAANKKYLNIENLIRGGWPKKVKKKK